MFWDDENDNKGWQIFKNMTFLKMPVDNETRDEMMPVFGIMMLVVMVLGVLFGIGYLIFGK